MRVARVRSILWLISGLASAGAVVIIIAAVSLRSSAPEDRTAGMQAHMASTSGPAPMAPPLSSFEAAWQMPLRRPLLDPPASTLPTADASAKPAELAVRLIGTIIDGQHPRGVFMIGLTGVELKGVGEKVGRAKVLAIDDNSATLSYEGGKITLHREKKPFDPSGESYEAGQPANPPANVLSSDAKAAAN